MSRLLAATDRAVLRFTDTHATGHPADGLGERRPTCIAWDPWTPGRAWCGTRTDGVFRSDDAGVTWQPAGLEGTRIMALTPSPAAPHTVWVGTEPSAIWRGGVDQAWERMDALEQLPSANDWSFPPRPDTHHVRWIACHPQLPGRLWVAIEAGALVRTDNGGRSWTDRVSGGPYDTHELAVHPERPDTLRVSAGDGYFESHDGGSSWRTPHAGLDVGYLRSVAIDPGDPDTVVVSASSHAHAAYVAGRSDGRLYRRTGDGRWTRVTAGWPDPPATIAPLLVPGTASGELWAADERGVHRSTDGGVHWTRELSWPSTPSHLRGLAVTD